MMVSLSSRLASFLLSLAIHLAFVGLLVTLSSPGGEGKRSRLAGEDQDTLVVTLLPLAPQPSERSPMVGATVATPSPLMRKADDQGIVGRAPVQASAAAKRDAVPPSQGRPAAPAALASRAGDLLSAQYRDLLLAHIARYRHYPEDARRNRQQGTALVRFLLDRDGHVLRLWIDSSSGQAALDDEAAAAVRRAQPLPPIPADLPDRIDITVPINFELG